MAYSLIRPLGSLSDTFGICVNRVMWSLWEKESLRSDDDDRSVRYCRGLNSCQLRGPTGASDAEQVPGKIEAKRIQVPQRKSSASSSGFESAWYAQRHLKGGPPRHTAVQSLRTHGHGALIFGGQT